MPIMINSTNRNKKPASTFTLFWFMSEDLGGGDAFENSAKNMNRSTLIKRC